MPKNLRKKPAAEPFTGSIARAFSGSPTSVMLARLVGHGRCLGRWHGWISGVMIVTPGRAGERP